MERLRGFQCPRAPYGLGAETAPGNLPLERLRLYFESLLRKAQRLAGEVLAKKMGECVGKTERRGSKDGSEHRGWRIQARWGRAQSGQGSDLSAASRGHRPLKEPGAVPTLHTVSPARPRALSPSGPRSPGRRLPSRRVPKSPFMLPTVRPPPFPSVAQVRVWLRGAISLTVMHLGHEKWKVLLNMQPATSSHWAAEALLKKGPFVLFGGSPSQRFMK